jgi:predicted TIM-barrel fold metal-dependent hydrolase
MITRREMLIGAGLAGIATTFAVRNSIVFASAAQPSTPVNFKVPDGACDCHAHIFGDPQKYPFAIPRSYTPEIASVDEMRALHRALHIPRVVIVETSVYGTDGRCTIDAVKQQAPNARGVIAIAENTTNEQLDELYRNGIRGIRVDLDTGAGVVVNDFVEAKRLPFDPEVARQRVRVAIERIKGRPLHIELSTHLPVIEAVKEVVMASPVPISFNHFGGAQAALGVTQPWFDTLLGLVHGGKAYVKLSGPYRVSKQAPDYPDVTPLAKALIAANPSRVIWGTDWPHPAASGRPITEVTPFWQIDDGRDLNQLATWADASQLKLILVENPARLYGF